MERELMPDYAAEAFYQSLIPPSVFDGSAPPEKENNRCVLFCKKVTPHLFEIKNGVAVVDESKNVFNDGVCLIAPSTKVVFVFE